jgi:6-phosphogluconolactonase (cycloisomerase 2 family)
VIPETHASGARTLAFVGSWTSDPDSADGGVRVFDVAADGSLALLSRAAPELSAGSLALSPDGSSLYCVDERRDSPRSGSAGGGVASFAVDPVGGQLRGMHLTPSGGALPCHVGVSPSGDLVAVANHGSYEFSVRSIRRPASVAVHRTFDAGVVALLPVESDGSLGAVIDIAVLDDRPPGTRAPVLTDPSGRFTGEFQASSHPHAAVFHPSEPVLVVPDKGTDTIWVFGLEPAGRRLSVLQRLGVERGVGPRHVRFHPSIPVAYVVHELVPSMTVLAWDTGSRHLRPVQTLSTVMTGADGVIWPSEVIVHPSGAHVYVSNRGHDSIAVYRVERDGRLTATGMVSCGGRTPRAFEIDPGGTRSYVLNQDSGAIVTLALDPVSGTPTAIGPMTHVERPVSIVLGRY